MDGMSDFERIDQDLRTLIVSTEGTIPGSRPFGISAEVFDLLPQEARNDFVADLDEKVEMFIPEIQVTDVSFRVDENTGTVGLDIAIETNDEYEEDDEE